MIQTDRQQEYRSSTSKVIPALIHIQELDPGFAATESQRRITVLLDHPVVRQLGWSSWSLAIVGLAGTQKVTAVPLSLIVLAGLLVGIVNVSRWLFGRKR